MNKDYIFKKGTNDKTFILLHGTGGSMQDLIPLATRLDGDANILSIKGRLEENGYSRYFIRFAVGHFDLESYYNESVLLANKIKELANKYELDLDKATVIGFSNGANIALGLIQNTDVNIKNYALLSVCYINHEKEIKNAYKSNILITKSNNDPYINLKNLSKLEDELTNDDHNVTVVENKGHLIDDISFNSLIRLYK